MKKISGISKRWLYNSFSIIAGLICLFVVFAIFFIRGYYYNYVEMTLDSYTSDLVSSYFSNYIGGSNDTFVNGAINYIENFSDKDKMDVWVIDKSGNPIISSSGFGIEDEPEMPDYEEAISSGTSKGIWHGRLSSGEKVMAVTTLLPSVQGKPAGAVRYISSLEEVDKVLVLISGIILIFALIVIIFVFASGRYFIRSIVHPVQMINDTAKEIAKGKLSVRVDNSGMHDEIDELCTTFNDMAEALGEAEAMKNDFISTISHELRTPLTAIKGWGETLMQIGVSDSQTLNKGMSVITHESDRLSQMVEELLDFSRMQNGKMQLNRKKIDVFAELDDAAFALKDRAVKAGLDFVYDVPQVPLPMWGDSARIRQVFVNLIDNAIKYNKKGGTVKINAKILNDSVVIVFEDTGCGISEEDLPKVKEKFFRANLSIRGTGIGLAVADEIITLHEGKLDIESKYGEGTKITVTLPVDPIEVTQSLREGI